MPLFRLETNIPEAKIPADLPAKLCQILSKTLEKPVSYCSATVIGGVKLSWGGGNDPAAQATLMSIGGIGVSENKKHAKVLYECITKELGIPGDKMHIVFTNLSPSDVGYTGTTYHEILG